LAADRVNNYRDGEAFNPENEPGDDASADYSGERWLCGSRAGEPIRFASAEEYAPAEGKQLTAMSTVNCVGVVLQVLGLVLGMWLLGRLHVSVTRRELRVFGWGRSAGSNIARFFHWLFRRPGKKAMVYIEGADTAIGDVGVPHVTTGRGPLPAGSAEERIKWLDDFVHDVDAKHNELSRQVWELTGTLNQEVSALRQYAEERIDKAVDAARADFRALVGKDLGWEVVSLGMIALGVLLAAC
jgi:hypothetical protein